LKLHLFSRRTAIFLMLTTLSQLASAVLSPDIREAGEKARREQAAKARQRAPVVLDIRVDHTERRGRLYTARATVLDVVRSHRRITTGDRIIVEYRDISNYDRQYNDDIKRNKTPGPGFRPVLHLLKRNDSVRAYLTPLPDRATAYTLGAGIDSFSFIPVSPEKK
jgi:hypothetical protein